MDEVRDVLERPKMRRYLPLSEVPVYLQRVFDASTIVEDPKSSASFQGLIPSDPDDDYIPGLALRSKAGVIVSGDPHLQELKAPASSTVRSRVQVFTPRQFLDELR